MADLQDNFKAGDPLSHETMNAIVRALKPPDVRVGPGLSVRRGARGQVQLTTGRPMQFVGSANGNITARSGSAWGTGSVSIVDFDPIAGTENVTSVSYDVVNPSSNTMSDGYGIDSGQRCWVQEDDAGNLIVSPLECS